jgi:small subunit ribosomal protein S16
VPVKLRLVRMGKKKQPTYRLVAADSRSPRDGRFLEVLGTYEPRGASRAQPETVLKVDNDKAVHWLQHGAQPTERVEKLLRASGAWATFTGAASAEPPVAATPAAAPASPAPSEEQPVEVDAASAES